MAKNQPQQGAQIGRMSDANIAATGILIRPTDQPFGDFSGLEPWEARPEPAPVARPAENGFTREDLRALILEELRELVHG